MSMPPAGVVGAMDQDAVIQAQIDLELDNINLDEELDNINVDDELDEREDVADDDEENVQGIPEELDKYIKRLQEQTSNFERELEECDELIAHTDRPKDNGTSDAVIPYEDFNLLSQLAKESGCDIDQYKQQILLELEQDEDILHDDLADLLTDDNGDLATSDFSRGQGRNTAEVDSSITSTVEEKETAVESGDPSLPIAIERAVEQGIDPTEIPVSQELVPLNYRAGIQQMLREQLVKLENTYRERTERIKQEEAVKREKEETRQRQAEEERQHKKQEIEKQEQKLLVERQVAEKQIKKEEEEAERQIADQLKKLKDEMRVLDVETERQKAELAKARMDEEIRQIDKQHHSALSIQRVYRGYRTRKQYLPVLEEKREERRKVKEECRIKEIEKEIEERETIKAEEEGQKRLKLESEKRRKEEEKQRKEEEKRLKEEEKRKKKEEEERKKAEEKKRKEEEKQRLEDEKRRKKEEEKRRKEKEAERKREEKRLKEEEEKRRKEEEKLKKEDENRKKEEEKQLKEQEKKRIVEGQTLKEESHRNDSGISKEETKQKETSEQDLSLDLTKKDRSKDNKEIGHEIDKENFTKIQNDEKVIANIEAEVNDGSHNKLTYGSHISDNMKESKQNKFDNKNINDGRNLVSKSGKLEEIIGNVNRIENDLAARAKLGSSNEMKEGKSPRVPHPPLSPKKKQQDLSKDVLKSVQKSDRDKPPSEPIDCLPQHLEDKRISFIKDCLPWSKISNEPWKLKGVTSKKPLRRPSSAKKLSPLPEDFIVKAARVASLKQVTTVELCDLPGYSMSPLGQCWGLKYLSMVRCNLRLIEGLQQCKQLLYIDVKDNKIEYIDLKDVGSLQVLDMSNNCLSSVHGLDNCTNLRWLDISHNNITRLGGLETLRRLHTLKLSHNQLISTAGLGDTPTLQVLDVSANHLQAVENLEKLCLLLSVDVSANNILKVPSLKNQVLLHDLLLTDNSITSLEELCRAWLPLLYKVNVSQNSIMEPENLENCLTLRDLDISGNQILDAEVLKKCIQNCLYLEQLNPEENPFIEEVDNSFYDGLHQLLPRLQGSGSKHTAVKPRCSFETMCLSQAQVYTDMFSQLEQNIRNHSEKSSDLAHKCDSYFKFCDKTFQIAVEHRYAHEYGEVSVSIPTAPITPRSGRPNSARKIVPKGETFTNPKDLFEKALQSSNKTSVVNSPNVLRTDSADKTAKPVVTAATAYSNPKDLFEQALKSSTTNSNSSHSRLVNGLSPVQDLGKSVESQSSAAVRIQAAWRGWSVRHKISKQTQIWLAAVTIQSAWRGYRVRKWYRSVEEERRNIDPELVEKLHIAATRIQAAWRGYWLRSKLLAALEYARFEDDEDDDDDALNLNGEDFDIDKFMDFNEDLFDNDWRPPSTPEIPSNHPVLRKPPSGRPKIPPISTGDRPPSNPRRAWKNLESPMSDIQKPLGRIPRPPSSVSSGADTHRTGMSKKEEKLSEEWGFKDSSTAHLMMQRAKKMKYNAERKKKISKLDPKQRLRLFTKLQEDAHINQPVHVPQRKTLLPRKEYFQAQQDEMVRKEQEKQDEYKIRASRIYEWLHMPVNNYPVTDSVINKGLSQGQGQRFASDSNLPDVQMGKRVQLTSGPGSLELQSVDSMSNAGDRQRRFSVGSGSSIINKLPPIQSSSAPTAKTKERMSWRNPKVNQSVGWGGGKKRGNVQ